MDFIFPGEAVNVVPTPLITRIDSATLQAELTNLDGEGLAKSGTVFSPLAAGAVPELILQLNTIVWLTNGDVMYAMLRDVTESIIIP